MKRLILHAIIMMILFSACNAASENAPKPDLTPSVFVEELTAAPAATEVPTPTPPAKIFDLNSMDENNPLCALDEDQDQFTFSCTQGQITIKESEKRRGMDIFMARELPAEVEALSLQANVTSIPADPARLDQNQVGFFISTKSGRRFALRLQGQFFNFEEWIVENGKEKIIALNQSYAPSMLPAGSSNSIRLVCMTENCDLLANGTLAGRFPLLDIDNFSSVGYFAASPWDERFGSVTINNLIIEALPASQPEIQAFSLDDGLTADNGTFSKMGLSGAFSDFESDGFHFSPVIPYGYYSAKAGPALRDVSVSATVEMDFTPGQPATQYGGVMCRGSNEGMVVAVLRVNGTYTIYRDSELRSFAMLATDIVESIGEGRSAHRLRLDCIDETIALFIDGNQVESLADTRYGVLYGRSGLYTKAGGAAYSDAIIFRDFEINEIR